MFCRHLPVMSVCIYRSEDHLVSENHVAIDRSHIQTNVLVVRRNTCQAENSVISYSINGLYNDRCRPSTFDSDVRTEAKVLQRTGVILGTQIVNQLRLEAMFHTIEDVDFKPPL